MRSSKMKINAVITVEGPFKGWKLPEMIHRLEENKSGRAVTHRMDGKKLEIVLKDASPNDLSQVETIIGYAEHFV
jgi:hypothetical protein